MSLTPEQQKLVMDSALQLMSSRNLNDITLEQLTRASGVPAFDIIRHYQSRENILAAVLERELELIAGAVPTPELRFPSETIKDELQVLARVMLQEYRARLQFLHKLFAAAIQDPEVGVLFYRKFIQQGRLLFAEFLNVRKQRGELRPDVDVEAAAAMYISALSGILLVVEFFGGQKVEPLDEERLVRELTDVFLNGVVRR
ncbi:MAG TPA: TetR/AcrR family transcriptional regulator C-terminal ligand-binding domain-containing protein [Terriglobia bacterium]|nr:TetR/AcrR family transcriptional regulator C-terminal ligand-binding domain-containing protein [Terriglobia bacterium]